MSKVEFKFHPGHGRFCPSGDCLEDNENPKGARVHNQDVVVAKSTLLPTIASIPCYIEFVGLAEEDCKTDDDSYVPQHHRIYLLQTLTFEEQQHEPGCWACGGCLFEQYFVDCAHKTRHLLCDNDGWTQHRRPVPALTAIATTAWEAGVRPQPDQLEIIRMGKTKSPPKKITKKRKRVKLGTTQVYNYDRATHRRLIAIQKGKNRSQPAEPEPV